MSPPAPSKQDQPLAGRAIGVPEARELDLFARMIETRGGVVARCPLISIRDTPDSESIKQWLIEVTSHPPDVMIWMTGEGVRRIDGFAHRFGTRDSLHTALGRAHTITRGPKPVRALRDLGLAANHPAPAPTTDGVIAALDELELAGKRVGLQLYGREPNHKLQQALTQRGASVYPVAPYVYADASDDTAVSSFIARLVAGKLNAVALTSAAQVKRLFDVADQSGQRAELTAALEQTCVAAVGPLVARALRDAGVNVDLMPDHSYHLKPLVRALVTHFDQAAPTDRS